MKKIIVFIIALIILILAGIGMYLYFQNTPNTEEANIDINNIEETNITENTLAENVIDRANIEIGTTEERGFIIDNVLHSDEQGDIHYASYFPDGYDETKQYAIYFALPGWEGLYFQGVGANVDEPFPYEAQKYNEDMIIISPQLDDWGEESADDTIELVEYFLNNYNIDKSKVYISGASGGGETLSIILGKRPELFTSALFVNFRDGP